MSWQALAPASKISSCNLRAIRKLRSQSPNLRNRPRSSNEKRTPHREQGTQELLRFAHRLSLDGGVRSYLRLHVLCRNARHDPHEPASPNDGPVAADERKRSDHPAAVGLR